MIQHSPSQIIAAYLIQAGVFSTPGAIKEWNLFSNSMPKIPIELGATYNFMGIMDGREQGTGRTVEHPGFQVMLRTQQDDRASIKANQVFAALDAVRNTQITVGDVTYNLTAAHRTSPLLPVKEEEGGGRLLFVINGILTFQEVTE